jgi:hypothetical protein
MPRADERKKAKEEGASWGADHQGIGYLKKRRTDMVTRKTWKEFRESGLLWWINMILHTLGWAIVVEVEDETGEIKTAYPARVKFRGFDEKSNTDGYIKVSEYIKSNADELDEEAKA